jgi:hypothetical protein
MMNCINLLVPIGDKNGNGLSILQMKGKYRSFERNEQSQRYGKEQGTRSKETSYIFYLCKKKA